MIHKNLVLIETIEGGGTGILYPCKVRRNLFKEMESWENSWQYVLVLTNSHVLSTIGLENQEKVMDFKPQVLLHFYDNMQKEIQQQKIKKILVYNSGCSLEGKDDIAALLVALDNTVSITLEEKIDSSILENRKEIFMEGYPGVLYEDAVSGRLQLQGMEKKIFPLNEDVGVYQITDDYHWYNGFQDRWLLQGLSGSPVYRLQGADSYLLGMTQSVSDIHRGENPFKLMYYIRLPYVFKHLREANCIIYTRKDEYTWELEWIYGQREDGTGREVSLLLLGGSGAGKSTLAKAFAYHGNELYSTNDGQTTRTKVFYNYFIIFQKPNAEVKFLNQAEFCDRMMEKVGHRPALLLVQKLFDLEEDSVKDEIDFLENCYKLFSLINKKKELERHPNVLEDIQAVKNGEINNRQALSCYEDIFDIFFERFDTSMVKYLLDDCLLQKIKINYRKKDEENRTLETALIEYLNEKDKNFNMNLLKLLNTKYLEKYCKNDMDHEEAFKSFQKGMIGDCLGKVDNFEEQVTHSEQSIFYKLQDDIFLQQYQDVILFCEGYFDIREFLPILPQNYQNLIFLEMVKKKDTDVIKLQCADMLFEINEKQEETESLYNSDEQEKWISTDRKPGTQLKVGFCSRIKEYYRSLHVVLKKQLKEKYGVSENPFQLTFELNRMNLEKRRLLRQCLQVTDSGSLTGLVNYVLIQDMVSDEYATILQELGISKLQMVDTCGLDHIEVKNHNMLKRLLYENLYEYEYKKLVKMSNISVLYVKKLDSGKPDELRTVLPCVREVFPSSPVYCLFTGIDIFYRTPEEIASIRWKQENQDVPKAVKYIMSEKFKNDCNVEDNMYIVMRNNLIPYCGNTELVKNNFQTYKNNITYIRMLLASISIKEYSSLEIIETELLERVLEKLKRESKNNNKEQNFESEEGKVIKATEDLIRDIFSKASLQSYSFRYNTKQADILSFCLRNRMSYSGTYFHQLNQRFHEGYSNAVSESGGRLADELSPKKSALKAAMKNMESMYLGEDDNLVKVNIESKNSFRITLDKMFETGYYEYNPMNVKWSKEELKENRDRVFDDIFNFKKGLRDPNILREFVLFYLECLKKQIEEDNRIKSENILKLNSEFTNILQKLKDEFMEKYRTGELSTKELENRFNEMMKYYFEGRG